MRGRPVPEVSKRFDSFLMNLLIIRPPGGEPMLQGSKRTKAGGGTRVRLLIAMLALAVGCVPPRGRTFHAESLRDQFEDFRARPERVEKPRASARPPPTGLASSAPSVPPFRYDLYCDAQGRLGYAGADLALVRRPEHLRQVYADATRGRARAKELVRQLEQVFQDFGIWVADATTSPPCLPLPELTPGCLPKLAFLDELLGSTPEAARLREVVAQAYEARARERGAQSRVIAATLNLVLAAGMAKGVMSRAEVARLGDLTPQEIEQIQAVVDKAGRPLEVVGSAAKGQRRGVETDLPIGKGLGTRSDIDYVAPPSSHPYFKDLQSKLPGIDPKTGIAPGTHNPYVGPAIRFEPGTQPRVVPEAPP